MTSKEIDRLARGPNPRARVPVPKPGERCSRCHAPTSGFRLRPCLLCRPDLVPVAFGGVKEIIDGLNQVARDLEAKGAPIES